MKKLLLATVALAAQLVSPAIAADWPVMAPAYSPPPPPAVYSWWTGCYLGGNLGGGGFFLGNNPPTVAAVLSSPHPERVVRYYPIRHRHSAPWLCLGPHDAI